MDLTKYYFVIYMKKLVKKMFRDLSDHKIQFLSIFIMAFIGAFAYTGISGAVVGISDVSTHYYEDTNLAGGWIYGEDFDKNIEHAYVSDGEYYYYNVNKYSEQWLNKQPFDFIVREE